jgi:hypothetical protein
MLGLLRFWREGIIAFLTISLLSMIWHCSLVKKDLITEKAERAGIETALNMQSGMIESNRVEYEGNLKTANERKNKVFTEYKTKTQVIYQWRENNATCDDAIRYLNNYPF